MSPTTDSVEEVIKHAELMLNGNEAERKEACATLRRIAEERDGTPYAARALRLLERCEPRPAPLVRDVELEALSYRWEEIHSLTHRDLLRFLRDLSLKPAAAARLLPAVFESLRGWIAAEVPKVGPDLPPDRVAALETFVAAVSELQTYAVELDELKHLRNALFHLRLERAEQKIACAVAAWCFDDAWAAFETLVKPPVSFEAKVKSLQDGIYSAQQSHREVVSLLEKGLREDPAGWGDAACGLDHARALARVLREYDLPADWRARAEAEVSRCEQSVGRFLAERAGEARDLAGAREFWSKYLGLDAGGQPAVTVRKEWLQDAMRGVALDTEAAAAVSISPEALDAVALKLQAEALGLPDFMAGEMMSLAAQVERTAAAWRQVAAGGSLSAPEVSSALLPEAFRKELGLYGERLALINEAFAKLSGDDWDAAVAACEEAAHVADDILAEAPAHALAQKLRAEARRKLAALRLERELGSWRVEEALALCGGSWYAEDEACAYLIANAPALTEVGSLARAPDFSGWHMPGQWWGFWRTAVAKLPDPVPDMLARAIRREQERRADQWYAVLAPLLSEPLRSAEWESVAASLKKEAEALNLGAFQRAFQRKAVVARAERLITEKDWRGAAEQIRLLDEDDGESRRLRTHLALAQARETGVVTLSEILKSDWGHISEYLGDEAYEILAGAVQEAWEGERTETLKRLRMVVGRVLTTRAAPPAYVEHLAQWEEWFDVENSVASGELSGVKLLVAYLGHRTAAEPLLRLRLGRLVANWRAAGDAAMLAWAHEAFRHYAPLPFSESPSDEMARAAEDLAARAESEMASNASIEPENAESLLAEIARREADWKRLNAYLDELPEDAKRFAPSEGLMRAKARLEALREVWSTLAHLRDADMRLESEPERMEACRRTLKLKLEGVAVQPRLLAQLEQFEPLVPLRNLEGHVMVAADKCGDDRMWDEPGVFARVERSLREMIGAFEAAQAVGGELWRKLSAEYGQRVRAAAHVFTPPPADLGELALQFGRLEEEERDLVALLSELWGQRPVPPVGGELTAEHVAFLKRLPAAPPRSRRGFIQFRERFAKVDWMPVILERGRGHLPQWICEYLDEGIPMRADEV
jgi:hypothetical protein